ncbi:DUF4034 domain-containing protein [Deinococcus sp. HMF7620]|uniref:DUF4034 domain-containing protein n=1 Tax=Deinococcus arboris TaxID=2682977 RepID=A0A7C9MSU9_9DEIO|nr:DUF4034 domain-containing protein [Deinococcus arboris]MVN88384.1 DUF4034 domain-containing protein [Deinococcus arboris]
MNAAPNLLHQLRTHQYGALQEHLSRLQEQFEAGQLAERDLLNAFQAFQNPDPALGEQFGEWMEAHVGSYPAHVALAQWLLARAWDARGEAMSSHVSDQGWRGLRHFTEQATACARHAVTLSANPLAAWMVVGLAANSQGCQVSVQDVESQQYPDWLTEGLRGNPHSLALRRAMLLHLREEWGGSEAQMLAFVRQQQDGGQLSEGDVQRLWAEFHARMSHHAMSFAKDYVRAVERAQLAANLRGLHADQLFTAMTVAGRATAERRAALEQYLTAAEQDPHAGIEGNALVSFIYAWEGLEALTPRVGALLLRAAEQGDTEAAVGLGRLKLHGPAAAVPDPLPWLLRAREEGSREAADLLVELGALRPPGVVREDVLKAADLGSPDMSWRVYGEFAAFRQQFDLEDRARYRYLLRAADAGNNDARFELAQQLRAGFVEVGEDSVLRPVNTPPLQDSLNYAKHLLERAAGSGHTGAQKVLNRAREQDWEAGARRLRLRPQRAVRLPQLGGASVRRQDQERPLRVPWFLLAVGVVLVFRACSHSSAPAPVARSLTSAEYGVLERLQSGEVKSVGHEDGVTFQEVREREPTQP